MSTSKSRAGSQIKAKPKSAFPYTDAEIKEALDRVRRQSRVSDIDFKVMLALAEAGAKHITSRRRGGARPRETSRDVTKRLEALIDVYRALPPKFQKTPTGARTIQRLRKGMLEKLGLRDGDDILSEETIRQGIRQVRPILRAVQQGRIPTGPRPPKHELSQQTQQEMQCGRKTLAAIRKSNNATAAAAPATPLGPIDPDVKMPKAVLKAVAVANGYFERAGQDAKRQPCSPLALQELDR